jgi:transcriptional regulator with XRE-family HTH domain
MLRIKEVRENKGMTQGMLAEKAGISQKMISRYERGEQEPTAGKLEDLASALGVTPGDLFEVIDPVEEDGRSFRRGLQELWSLEALEDDGLVPSSDEDRADIEAALEDGVRLVYEPATLRVLVDGREYIADLTEKS